MPSNAGTLTLEEPRNDQGEKSGEDKKHFASGEQPIFLLSLLDSQLPQQALDPPMEMQLSRSTGLAYSVNDDGMTFGSSTPSADCKLNKNQHG